MDKELSNSKESSKSKRSTSTEHLHQTDEQAPLNEPSLQSSLDMLNGPRNTAVMRQQAVMHLQRQYGNASTVRRIQQARSNAVQRDPPQTINITDPTVVTPRTAQIGANTTGTQEIDTQMQNWVTAMGNFWTNYHDGLELFSNRMNWGSDQSAEANYLKAVTSAVGKKLFDMALDKVVGELIPGGGQVVSVIKTGVEAAWAEHERSEAAAGRVQIGNFIQSILQNIGPSRQAAQQAIQDHMVDMRNQFQAAITADQAANAPPSGGSGASAAAPGAAAGTAAGPTGLIVGAGADFIRGLRTQVSNFQRAVPAPVAFQQQISESFATMNGTGMVGAPTSGDMHQNGAMYINVHVYINNGALSMREIDDNWTLRTNSPQAAEAAASLQQSLQGQGKNPWQSNLAKNISFDIETESGSMFTYNTHLTGSYFFTDPSGVNRPTINTISSGLQGFDDTQYMNVWNNLVRAAIQGKNSIRGSA